MDTMYIIPPSSVVHESRSAKSTYVLGAYSYVLSP